MQRSISFFSKAVESYSTTTSFRRISIQQTRSFSTNTELNNFHTSPDPNASFKLDDELFKLDELKGTIPAPETKLNSAKIGKGFILLLLFLLLFLLYF